MAYAQGTAARLTIGIGPAVRCFAASAVRAAIRYYDFVNSSFGSFTAPATSTIATASLRLAGPLPLKLPGGATQITVNLERSRDVSGATIPATPLNGRRRSLRSMARSPFRSSATRIRCRYVKGVVTYLDMATAQSAALRVRRSAIELSVRRLQARVALGGGLPAQG